MEETVTATYHGTSGDDHVTGVASESNTFKNFGIGRDYLVGGLKSDVSSLQCPKPHT